jgi:hypothetical protein
VRSAQELNLKLTQSEKQCNALFARAKLAEYHLAEMLGTVSEYEAMQTKCLATRLFTAAYRARQAVFVPKPAVFTLSETMMQAQCKSLARAEAGFGSDADEAAYRAALVAGDDETISRLDAEAAARVAALKL